MGSLGRCGERGEVWRGGEFGEGVFCCKGVFFVVVYLYIGLKWRL